MLHARFDCTRWLACILASFVFVVPVAALAQTQPVYWQTPTRLPPRFSPYPQQTSTPYVRQGVTVQAKGHLGPATVLHVIPCGLSIEGDYGINTFGPMVLEPMPGDIHDNMVAAPIFGHGYGIGYQTPSSDIFTWTPSSPLADISDINHETENYTAIYNGRIVWQWRPMSVTTNDWEIVFFDPASMTQPVVLDKGQRPAIDTKHIAWELYSDLAISDGGPVWAYIPSPSPGKIDYRLPALGGERIFYEEFDNSTGEAQIKYREIGSLKDEFGLLDSPCKHQYRPRVSNDGHWLLYFGLGAECSDGKDGQTPLYLAYIEGYGGKEVHYLVADLKDIDYSYPAFTPYDIDDDAVAFQVYVKSTNVGRTYLGEVDRAKMHP